jgi:hypothetical protein
MFQRIKGYFAKLEEPTISDPVLGGLHNEGLFWWSRIHFPPTGTVIEVIIPNAGREPENWQRDFFLKVVEEYPLLEVDLTATVAGVVAAELARGEYLTRLPNVQAGEFELEAITLPEDAGSEAQWGVSYYCQSTDRNYTVHLQGWRIVRAENIGG